MILGATLEAAIKRAESLREEVKNLIVKYKGQPLGAVTISIGVAVFPANGNTVEALLNAADKALYQAKAQGRDRVVAAVSDEQQPQ